MAKRKLTWILAIVLGIFSVVGIFFGASAVHDITLTEAEVQKKLDTKMPFVGENFVVNWIKIDVAENSLVLTAEAEGRKLGQNIFVSIRGDVVPRYNARERNFYLKPQTVEITKLLVNGVPVAKKVESFIDNFVESPKLNTHKEVIGTTVEVWVRGSIEKAVVLALNEMPVYTLPNTLGGNAVMMLLRSVNVESGAVILKLSFWQFTKMVVLYIAVFIMAIGAAVALMANPEWGCVLLMVGSAGDG